MRIAAIDVGTNTIRLLVADCSGKKEEFKPIFRKQLITRLGAEFASRRAISESAMERTVRGLIDFKRNITRLGADKVIAVATGVVRKAKNSLNFIQRVKEETGIEIHPISGEIEAKLSARGALLPVNSEFDQALIFDIGGGSTEFIFTQGTDLLMVESIELGVVHLSEEQLYNDPPQKKELTKIEKIVDFKIREVRKRFQRASFFPFKPESRVILIGIAGTATTLAAIDLRLYEYDREKIINHTLQSKRIAEILRELIRMTAAKRLSVPGLEKGREDLIIPGLIIVLKIMKAFGFSVLRVIDSGILEGLVLSYSSSGKSIPCFSKR
jgi:exopolyphosphatase/guanosine-5'-triphosphate,3'-diphosphate pyrophosphatase